MVTAVLYHITFHCLCLYLPYFHCKRFTGLGWHQIRSHQWMSDLGTPVTSHSLSLSQLLHVALSLSLSLSLSLPLPLPPTLSHSLTHSLSLSLSLFPSLSQSLNLRQPSSSELSPSSRQSLLPSQTRSMVIQPPAEQLKKPNPHSPTTLPAWCVCVLIYLLSCLTLMIKARGLKSIYMTSLDHASCTCCHITTMSVCIGGGGIAVLKATCTCICTCG